MNYRESYLVVPMMLTMTSAQTTGFSPATSGDSADFAVGLKNWYGSIVHSLTLDMNGTTCVQQTPLIGLWNTFKLMTSMSYQDILSQGQTIGFYPDTASSFCIVNSTIGDCTEGTVGISNNRNCPSDIDVNAVFAAGQGYNKGLTMRQSWWNFDLEGISGANVGAAKSNCVSATNLNSVWKSYVFNKINSVAAATNGVWQTCITAIIYLKHLHSFFERMPLLKGVFFKMTLNLNQSSVNFTTSAAGGNYSAVSVSSPLGGVSPIMLSSTAANNGCNGLDGMAYTVSLCVGNKVINSSQSSIVGVKSSPLGGSIILNVPAYSFNPSFEQAYCSQAVKKIVYEDLYQYQIVNQVVAGGTFNNLITNGIANIKSVLVLPYYSVKNLGGTCSATPIQSPFDPAGGGPTSPLCLMSQFNVQISGQNAIYNTQRYSHEEYCNHLYGANSVNGGMSDGMMSGLVGRDDFEQSYCYYYVNVGRGLDVEQSIPKSVNIMGTTACQCALDLYVFVSYGCSIDIDITTGARV
jgi:hypothetical protein